jgi:hypothetical protein
MRKVVLNCSVVVIAALFSLWIDACSVAGGLHDSTPPPPCPPSAGECDACELQAAARAAALCLTPTVCNSNARLVVTWVNRSTFWLGAHW